MRGEFAEFYRLATEDVDKLWRGATFAVDASVLLHLYRYSTGARTDLLAVLGKLQEQLWLPHQAGLEFLKNRPQVMSEQVRKFAAMRSEFETAREHVKALYRDPARPQDKKLASLDTAWKKLDEYIEEHEQIAIRPTLSSEEDSVLAEVTKLFDGRTGTAYGEDRLAEILEQGRLRFEKKTPPGFEDSQKPEPDRYGDLILWMQLVDKAQADNRPIVFVTADEKEDWWWRLDGKTLGPLPALRREMRTITGQDFWAYRPDQFVDLLGPFVDRIASDESIQELRRSEPLSDPPTHPEPKGQHVYSRAEIRRLIAGIRSRQNMLDRAIRNTEVRLTRGPTEVTDQQDLEERLADLQRRRRNTDLEIAALYSLSNEIVARDLDELIRPTDAELQRARSNDQLWQYYRALRAEEDLGEADDDSS